MTKHNYYDAFAVGTKVAITDLPFVRDATKEEIEAGSLPRRFWPAVSSTGDFDKNADLGSAYAIAAINYMVQENMTPILGLEREGYAAGDWPR